MITYAYIEIVSAIIFHIGTIIEYIGFVFIVAAVVMALIRLPMKQYNMEHIRRHLAQKTIFGLEFVIIADILLATVANDMTEILFLGGIVMIRVVLGYALRKEIS